jgi:hypothetical protein
VSRPALVVAAQGLPQAVAFVIALSIGLALASWSTLDRSPSSK